MFMNLSVIYEDNHLIAVNKPAGILSQGDKTGDEPLSYYVKRYIKDRYNKPGEVFLGTIHRLDRPVSGVTVFARTSKALTRMNALFKERKIQKDYIALVQNRPPKDQQKLENYLVKDHRINKVRCYQREVKNSKKSTTHYKVLSRINDIYALNVSPLTGRPHQIRVQLANIACPILGDLKYGSPKKFTPNAIALHCFGLEFIHPVKKTNIRITAMPPHIANWDLFDFEELLIFE